LVDLTSQQLRPYHYRLPVSRLGRQQVLLRLALVAHEYVLDGLAPVLPFNVEKQNECYQAAAAVRPGFGDAWWSLANLKTYRFSQEEIARMRAEEAAPSDMQRHLQRSRRCSLSYAVAFLLCRVSGPQFRRIQLRLALRSRNGSYREPPNASIQKQALER